MILESSLLKPFASVADSWNQFLFQEFMNIDSPVGQQL